ncbi:ATP-binding protein [Pontibacterium granulatum]|uniref:sensor histidine kinase n=1 Tax=Pontibacterium granulatum TaxID=2036029 RepID=UPI00249A10EF|nr:ATP-binding protein [Pontibacterium granulatum]MDI3325392.1 ATP-binding protein [Pontibacterium granulatum]
MSSFDAAFKANAGVKDIVGRGLIYDDNIALIELVKNSKDAGSPKVDIRFRNISNPGGGIDSDTEDMFLEPDSDEASTVSEIIISDIGSGMSQSDIEEKWLNIAYSEKREDQAKKTTYAGNKGVGRFSCDRLGRNLILYTKSNSGEFIKLPINWEEFEGRGKDDEISTIELKGEILDRDTFERETGIPNFTSGTVLKIQNLRSNWTAQKLKKLISELEKFSPSLDASFEVFLYSDTDYNDATLKKKINTKINNGILEKLVFKTTYIKSTIDSEGDKINTELFFQGRRIYHYRAKNPYKNLKNIKLEIHYLDTLTKSYFTRNIGVNANSYGSVFLFYNGFRISPYGNEKNDWLGLDQRKSQGTTRFLGTREIFGRIDITDYEDKFSVITSREGLAHNEAFYDLVAYDQDEKTVLNNGAYDYGFVTIIIRQLENFVVSGLDWNRLFDTLGERKSISADDALKNPERYRVKRLSADAINEACSKILKSNLDVEEFEIDHKLVSEIQGVNEEKYKKFVDDFVEKTESKSFKELSPSEKGIVKRIVTREKEKTTAAIEERDYAEAQAKTAKQELSIEKKKGLYLLATRRTLSDDADGLIHTVKLNNVEIKDGIDTLIDGISSGFFSEDQIIDRLGNIKLYALKTLKMAELATRSGYDRDIEVRSVDIEKYIFEYIDIYKNTFDQRDLDFEFSPSNLGIKRSISVLNLSIVLDNLLSNSLKWGASKIKCNFSKNNEGKFILLFSDNGVGLSDSLKDHADSIFDLGVREEPPEGFEGSGIGLYYSRKLLSEMNATINFEGNGTDLEGATFKVVFN